MRDKKIVFVGSGLIGTGIALSAITHGFSVVMYDAMMDKAYSLCEQRFDEGLSFMVEQEIIGADVVDAAKARISYTDNLEFAVKDAYFIQESVFENVPLKQSVIADIEKYAPVDAIIGTSTSSQSVSEIFSKAVHPERCLGAHPFLPAHLMPLIEIIKTPLTSDEAAKNAKALYEAYGKEVVVMNRDSIGFICNRFQSAVHREAVDLVHKGICSVEDADKALKYSFGLRWSINGQYLSLHLAAPPQGISSFLDKFGEDLTKPDPRLCALATWTTWPSDWCDVAAKGLEEELAHRTEEMGRDIPSIEKWRDVMTVKTLKLHGKL